MTPAEWIGLLALLIGVVGTVVGWMMRISRQLARVEAVVDRIGHLETEISSVQSRVGKHGERLSVLEAQ